MNKTEWDAMIKEGINLDRNRPADVTVAKIVMGWEAAAGNKYFKMLDGRLILQQRFRPTTDRNACALVLDEIERRGLKARLGFSLALDDVWQNTEHPHSYKWVSIDILRIDPDTICYCAVKAVETTT